MKNWTRVNWENRENFETSNKEHSRKASYNKSACYAHKLKFPDKENDFEGVEVINSASTNSKLQIKELLHILKKQPELNKQINP